MTAPDMGMSRRSLVLTPGLAAASGLVASLLPASLAILPAAASPAEAKSVIITGSNSGIGFDAAQKLVAGGHQVRRSSLMMYSSAMRLHSTGRSFICFVWYGGICLWSGTE